jgi:hypothetical protein
VSNGDPRLSRIRHRGVEAERSEHGCIEPERAVGDRDPDEGTEHALRDRVQVAQVLRAAIAEVALAHHFTARQHDDALQMT